VARWRGWRTRIGVTPYFREYRGGSRRQPLCWHGWLTAVLAQPSGANVANRAQSMARLANIRRRRVMAWQNEKRHYQRRKVGGMTTAVARGEEAQQWQRRRHGAWLSSAKSGHVAYLRQPALITYGIPPGAKRSWQLTLQRGWQQRRQRRGAHQRPACTHPARNGGIGAASRRNPSIIAHLLAARCRLPLPP